MTRRTFETREVLADAYRKRTGTMLRHVVEVDADGIAVRVLCSRVDVNNLADRYAGNPAATPTCRACKAALDRLDRLVT